MNPPKGIDLKFTSFKKKTAFTTLGNAKTNKSKYRPGGEWAEDPKEKTSFDIGGKSKPDFFTGDDNNNGDFLNNEVDFEIFDKKEEVVKPKKQGSKFGFIKKKKKNKNNSKKAFSQKQSQGIIPIAELKEEKYSYPRKIVNSIVEPIGARKRPSEGVIQKFIKQTANFDPRIVLSILFHILGEEPTVWLSKYRGLIVLEALLSRNPDFSEKMKLFNIEFLTRVESVCEGFEFSQRSHEALVKKVKLSVKKMISGDEGENKKNTGFDFNKMSEMMSKMEKEKVSKNGNFLAKMDKIKKKTKQKKQNPSPEENDLLGMDILGGSNGNNIDFMQKTKPNPQPPVESDDLFGLDFGGDENSNGFSRPTNNETKAKENNGNLDLFGLNLTSSNQGKVENQPVTSVSANSKYDDLDFL